MVDSDNIIRIFQDKVQQSERRIAELKQSFLAFINLDEDFMFSAEPESRGLLQPYIGEIADLKKYNIAIGKAIKDAKEIYNQLRQDGLVDPKKPEEPIGAIRGTINGYRSLKGATAAKLEKLKVIDPKTLETVILEENKKQADELKRVINVEIPGKIQKLESAIERIEKLFDGLDIPIPAPGQNLPAHGAL